VSIKNVACSKSFLLLVLVLAFFGRHKPGPDAKCDQANKRNKATIKYLCKSQLIYDSDPAKLRRCSPGGAVPEMKVLLSY